MKTHLILLIVGIFSIAKADAVDYHLTITEASHHLAEVEVVFSDVQTKAFNVKLPVWRSGKYQILDLSKNIRAFNVFDAQGKALTWQKDNKNTWRIFVNTPGIVKVRYQIYANDLRNRVSHIDDTHAFLDASGVFIYSESQRNKPLTVELKVPENWRSVSGMQRLGEHKFSAYDYDQLVDSPIESGIHQYDVMKVEQQTYEIVIWGEGNYQMETLKKDIEKLHYAAKDIWKTFPFKRYVYMYHVGDNLRGATEHVNSTIIQTDRFGFYPSKKYRKVIATTAHEFVHTWNVKSYRPAGITPYDYSRENYTDLFWMAEGKTSYYDNLLNVRSGIFSVEEYLQNMAEDIHRYINKPGRKVMSLAESSFDTWLVNNANRIHNTTVSIYLKGSLVSWLLDKEIRAVTENKKSIDDLSQLLYEQYASSAHGYTKNDVLRILKELTNQDFGGFWRDYVTGTKTIDFDTLLAFYGLQIKQEDKEDDEKHKASIGMTLKPQEGGLLSVNIIDNNGPAWQAGLTVGDKIVAINGLLVTDKNVKMHMENLLIGATYEVHYFHDGVLRKTTIEPIKATQDKLQIIPVKSPSRKQKNRFEAWLKQKYNDSFKDK